MDRRAFLLAAAGLPLALRSAPSFAGGTPLALVTADTEAHVVAVELQSGRIRRRLSTVPGPRSIETVGEGLAVVAHTAEGVVSLVDGLRLRVVGVVRGFGEPRYTAAAPDGRYAFVTDSKRGEVVALDVARLGVAGRVAVDGPARHLSIGPGGRRLWVALGSKAPEIVVVDVAEPSRMRVVRRLRPPFLAHDVGFVPGGVRTWVTSGDRRQIAVYDAGAGRVLYSLPAGAPPQHVTFLDGHGALRKRVQAAASSHDACFVMSR